MADDLPDTPARRILTRRGRAGFAGGHSSRAESLRASAAESDDVDDAIDPDTVRERILSTPAPAPAPEAEEGMGDARARLNEVAMAGSAAYSKEYRLTLLHRLLLRRVPLDQIASQLQVSISTIQKDRIELKKRLREQARELNINEIVGEQSELYNEISGMALRIASTNTTPTAMKLAAMRTSLAANADRTRFLTSAGVFDVLRYRRAEDGAELSDVQILMERTNEMLARLAEPEQTPRISRRRPDPGGFAPFSMDDGGASSGDHETEEI